MPTVRGTTLYRRPDKNISDTRTRKGTVAGYGIDFRRASFYRRLGRDRPRERFKSRCGRLYTDGRQAQSDFSRGDALGSGSRYTWENLSSDAITTRVPRGSWEQQEAREETKTAIIVRVIKKELSSHRGKGGGKEEERKITSTIGKGGKGMLRPPQDTEKAHT